MLSRKGLRIESTDSLTLLGFRFSNRPTVSAHMQLIRDKFNARSWMIRHLKRAGVPDGDLIGVYTSTIRSVLEYASCVYTPMLTQGDDEMLERLQGRVLKTIFGYHTSYREALEKSGLQSLKERRNLSLKKFTEKTVANPRFDDWFPTHRPYAYEIRQKKSYEEFHANTDRLFKSPLYAMRRHLNSD